MDGQQTMELGLPEAEVVIRVSGSDVCTLAFFVQDDGTMDVLTGIVNTAQVDSAIALLEDAQLALHGARWVTVDELVEAASEGSTDEEGSTSQDALPF